MARAWPAKGAAAPSFQESNYAAALRFAGYYLTRAWPAKGAAAPTLQESNYAAALRFAGYYLTRAWPAKGAAAPTLQESNYAAALRFAGYLKKRYCPAAQFITRLYASTVPMPLAKSQPVAAPKAGASVALETESTPSGIPRYRPGWL